MNEYRPMLLSELRRGETPPSGPDWGWELKFNGWRILGATALQNTVQFTTRGGNSFTDRVPDIAGQLPAALDGQAAVVDGEMVAFTAAGQEDRTILQRRLPEAGHRVLYFIFDLLELDGRPLIHRPLRERRDQLHELFVPQANIALSPSYSQPETVAELIRGAHERQLEGVVVKRLSSLYYPGKRSRDWLKYKFAKSTRSSH